MVKGVEVKNYENLSEKEVFERVKQELNPIQENLSEKKITIDDAKTELKRINDWIQWTKLEIKDKEKIWRAFDDLVENLEESIEKNSLQVEFDEVLNQIEKLTQKDLAKLKQDVQTNYKRTTERSDDVQQWIESSSKDLSATIYEASQDKNPIARKIGEWMENLMS